MQQILDSRNSVPYRYPRRVHCASRYQLRIDSVESDSACEKNSTNSSFATSHCNPHHLIMRDKSFLPDLLDKDEESNLTDQSSKRSDTEEGSNIETPDEQGLPNIITPTQNPTCNQKKNIPYNITHDPDSSSSSDESFIPDAQSTKRWSKNLPEISKPDKSQTYWWDGEPMNKDNAHSTFSDPNLHSSNSSLNKSTTSLPAYLGVEPENKKRKSDPDEDIQLITGTVEDIQAAVQDQEVNRNPVEGVKNKVGCKDKKVKFVEEGSNRGGRPRKESTEKLSRWPILRRAFDLAEEKGFDVRLFQAAFEMSLKKEKMKLMDDSNDMNPAPDIERDIVAHALVVRVKHHSNQVTRSYSRHTPESAANLYLTMDLSKEKYSYLVKDLRSRNCNILPGYDAMRKALQECLPPETVSTETEVRSSLQDMLNISGMSLVLMLILHYGWTPEDVRNLMLTVVWGFDSLAGLNNPHQKCQDKTLESKSPQTSLLVTSVTIIELASLDTGKTWLNPTPQSIRFCRTLRMSMEKESSDAIKNVFDRVDKETTSLVPYQFITKDDSDVRISFHVEHTIFDGKVVNELVGSSSTLRCPMCFKTNEDCKVSGSPR
ncbi:hypothetical protein QAD02_020846 [Eretmocerus hayati]|uniref:Uncharacterized protein n=1 Tax=Eretmocerus hayati TaxID=131215 RepID=A0ACC2PPK3_9HYME|nr:hypothetical protein QAD02_020846 [Eretmocerus hayati]